MAGPDQKRNEEFRKDVEAGLSITQLAEKYRLSKRQVSRLKKKLGLTATATSTSTKRMTFWLPVSTIEKIKKRAADQGKTASALLRDILEKH